MSLTRETTYCKDGDEVTVSQASSAGAGAGAGGESEVKPHVKVPRLPEGDHESEEHTHVAGALDPHVHDL